MKTKQTTKKTIKKDIVKRTKKDKFFDETEIDVPLNVYGTWEYNYTTDTFYYNKLTMALTFINVIIFAIIVWNNL